MRSQRQCLKTDVRRDDGHRASTGPELGQTGPGLGQHWARLGRDWARLGRDWAGTGPDWAGTGPDWAGTGPDWAGTGPDWAGTGPDWAGTGPELGGNWARLGRDWASAGTTLATCPAAEGDLQLSSQHLLGKNNACFYIVIIRDRSLEGENMILEGKAYYAPHEHHMNTQRSTPRGSHLKHHGGPTYEHHA